MKLRETILAEHSKKQKNKIVAWVGNSQQRFDQLFDLFINDEYRVVQRAAWPISDIVALHPQLIKKHFGKLIRNLDKPGIHAAVKRNTVRLLQNINIPKRHHGTIMDKCFAYVSDPREAPAVKAFSLTVLHHLSNDYPEILSELKLIVEENLPRESPAFSARAKKFFKDLS